MHPSPTRGFWEGEKEYWESGNVFIAIKPINQSTTTTLQIIATTGGKDDEVDEEVEQQEQIQLQLQLQQ